MPNGRFCFFKGVFEASSNGEYAPLVLLVIELFAVRGYIFKEFGYITTASADLCFSFFFNRITPRGLGISATLNWHFLSIMMLNQCWDSAVFTVHCLIG